MAFLPDPKTPAPVRIAGALARIHRENPHATCALCDRVRSNPDGLSLHHIYDRSDLWQNLVFLCGDGVRGCHGEVTVNHEPTLRALGQHVLLWRPDVVAYVLLRAGTEQGREWMSRRLFVSV